MERYYMNSNKAQWKEPELTTLISEAGVAQIYIASKFAFYKDGLSPSTVLATATSNFLLNYIIC